MNLHEKYGLGPNLQIKTNW